MNRKGARKGTLNQSNVVGLTFVTGQSELGNALW